MAHVIRVGDLFERVSAHRAAARAAFERAGEQPTDADVDRLIASAWSVLSGDVVDAVLRRLTASGELAPGE